MSPNLRLLLLLKFKGVKLLFPFEEEVEVVEEADEVVPLMSPEDGVLAAAAAAPLTEAVRAARAAAVPNGPNAADMP